MTALAEAPANHSARNDAEELRIPIDLIDSSPLNPRKHFNQEALEELAASIKEYGLIEPIVVQQTGEQYTLIAGERRWRAARLAGVDDVPARILPGATDADTITLMLIENLQRVDLDPIEEAEGYRQLMEIAGMKQTEIAAAVNRSQPAVANTMRLLDLPDVVRTHISEGRLSAAHGRALVLYAKYPKVCEAIARVAIEERWSSKRLEAGFGSGGIDTWKLPAELLTQVHEISEADAERHGLTVWGTGYVRMTPDVHRLKTAVEAVKAEHKAVVEKQLEAGRLAARPVEPDPEVDTDGKPPSGKRGRNGVAVSDLPRLKDLPYGSYEKVNETYGQPWPAACGPDCYCRAKAIDDKGNVVDISTKPRHISALRGQESRREAERKSESASEKRDRLAAVLEEAPALDARCLAVLVTRMESTLGYRHLDRDTTVAVMNKHLGNKAARARWSSGGDETAWNLLAEAGTETLVRILGEMVLLSEAAIAVKEHYEHMPAVMWYLAGAPEPTTAMVDLPTVAPDSVPGDDTGDAPDLADALVVIHDDDAPITERVSAARMLSSYAGGNMGPEDVSMVEDLLLDDEDEPAEPHLRGDAAVAMERIQSYMRKAGYSAANRREMTDPVKALEFVRDQAQRRPTAGWNWEALARALEAAVPAETPETHVPDDEMMDRLEAIKEASPVDFTNIVISRGWTTWYADELDELARKNPMVESLVRAAAPEILTPVEVSV